MSVSLVCGLQSRRIRTLLSTPIMCTRLKSTNSEKGADKVVVAAGVDLSKIKMLDGGDQPAGEKDILDLTSYTHKLSVVNGHLIGNGVDIEIDKFEEVRLPGF